MTYPSHSPTAVQVILSFLRLLPWHRQSSWVVPVMIWSSSYFKKLSLSGPPFISLDVRLHHLRQLTMMNRSRRVWTVGMSKWIKRDKGMSVRRLTMEDYYLSTIIKERQSLYGRWSSVFVSHTPAYAMFSQLWALSFQRYYRSSHHFDVRSGLYDTNYLEALFLGDDKEVHWLEEEVWFGSASPLSACSTVTNSSLIRVHCCTYLSLCLIPNE